jgi:multiple antibiotic resistance protein
MIMVSLNFADILFTFFALIGPQKVLLSFARIARSLDSHSLRLVAIATAATAACIGTACALTAHWLAAFFHISAPALELAASIAFFVYATGLVLGIHLDPAESPHAPNPQTAAEEADPVHPFVSGFRAMLLPFVVSPLGVAAALEESLSVNTWGSRWMVAGAFAIIALIDALCVLIFAPLLVRMHESLLEILSRLLGVLLAAVGVQLFLDGLTALGVLHASH